MASAHRSLARWATSVRAWPLWQLPNWLVGVIVLVVTAHAAAIAFASLSLSIRPHDLEIFGTLLACSAATVELRRKNGDDGVGVNNDVYGVWELAIAILLPPAYVLIAPIVRFALIQWRVRRTLAYRRIYTASSVALSFGAASVIFHLLDGPIGAMAPGTALGLAWLAAVFASGIVKTTLNKVLIMTAIKGSDPSAPVIKDIFGREPLYNELAELCIGALLTFGIAAGNLFLAPVALPVLVLLQRSLSHAQLLNDSRTDAKTGLLNARTWEREATAEVARAVRARTPLAVAVLDIDWFKLVNDTYGHLFGDEVLREIARCLPGVLREYDLAGRFGGEEFVLLLPHTRAVDAFRIADRVRDHISGLSLHTPDGQAVRVSVSVGVAALDAGSRRELSDLLAAADAALYRAKRDGRDQVQMISTSRGLSAVGARTASGVDVFSEAPAKPSAWDVPPRDKSRTAGDADEVAARV